MKATFRFALTLLMMLFVWPKLARPCPPEFPRAIFIRPSGPDAPLGAFAKGRLGIPLPTWRRAYLAVAYRYLSGRPLTRAEQVSFLSFWDRGSHSSIADETTRAVGAWFQARARYRHDPPPQNVSPWQSSESNYDRYINCFPHAFETAASTVRHRARDFGEQSTELQEWITGQDAVFQNCGRGSFIPKALPASANPLLRADRAYQIAAAHFYSKKLEDALREFDAISADTNSPWQTIAPYLAVRAIIRDADISNNATGLNQAEERLRNILADPRSATIHHDAELLQGIIQWRLHPLERQHELAHLLITKRSGADFGQHLLDYTLLLDEFLDKEPDFPGVEPWEPGYRVKLKAWQRKRYSELKQERADDLSDWLITVQSDSNAARLRAIQRWRATASIPWLFAVTVKLDGNDPLAQEVLRHVSEIPPTSAAYATFAYHRARLLRESGHSDEARRMVEEALRHTDSLPLSAINLLEDEQMSSSEDLGSFLNRLWRKPVQVQYGSDISAETPYCYGETACNQEFYGAPRASRKSELLPQFDASAAGILNQRLPIDLLTEASSSPSLPENLRTKLAPVAWARAALLSNAKAAQALADSAVRARPELAPYLKSYTAAQTDEERQFAAVFTIMHFPGLRPSVDSAYPRTIAFGQIDSYRDNWWCNDMGGFSEQPNFYKEGAYSDALENFEHTKPNYPAFLNTEQRAQSASEWKQLLSVGLAKDYFARVSLDWANRHPDDPRVPEALHYAWRSQRWGCDNGVRTKFPRELFRVLHDRYPKSDWTRKTTVWW